MTQLTNAKNNILTDEMRLVAVAENLSPETVCTLIREGRAVIPANNRKSCKLKFCGIGAQMKTKVNANIGTSQDYCNVDDELEKARVAIEAGADAIMDLSTYGDIREIRRRIIAESSVPVGTVPIYEAVLLKRPSNEHRSVLETLTETDLFDTILKHAQDGVDFITVHCGVTHAIIKHVQSNPRTGGIVSRGGTILGEWMKLHQKENPLYEKFDRVIEIAREYDMTLSLGDGLRPGAIADSFDYAQIEELKILAQLAERARLADVQVMIEGPGHVPLHQVQAQVLLQKSLCKGAPFYVLGPVVTDVAPGYDHITSAIGGAVAASAGADMLCYVTPMEHLGLPQAEHVREGVIASRIAAHAGDIAKGIESAIEWDRKFSLSRKNRDWDAMIANALDPQKPAAFRKMRKPQKESVCSMCGQLCVYALANGEKVL